MLVETPSPTGKALVRLINPNLNREETIRDIITAVDNLQAISISVFSAIRKRVEDQRTQLTLLDGRVTHAAERVEKVKSCAKAIRIISPAKYPTDLDHEGKKGPHILSPLVIHVGNNKGRDREDEIVPKLDLISARTSLPTRFEAPVKHPDELLACYHVREVNLPSLQVALQQTGLGKPSPRLKNVDSFLLFNTAENPYQHYRLPGKVPSGPSNKFIARKDNSFLHTERDRVPQDGQGEEQQQFQSKSSLDDFYYSPSTLDIPDIDVPDQLPDLPGIVDSLDYFSPSEESGGFFGGSPYFFPQSNRTTNKDTPSPTSGIISVESTSIPPPAIPTTVTPVPISSNRSSSNSKSTGVAPPPPPPPPPIMQEETGSSSKSSGAAKILPIASSGDDMRSSLMAAIRGADKSSLRSAQERKYEAKKKKLEEKAVAESRAAGGAEGKSTSGGGDLMADLKNSLAMRRKGISGIRVEGSRGGAGEKSTGGRNSGSGVGDIMARLASSIPTMEKSMEEEVEGNESEDEEDVDDWD